MSSGMWYRWLVESRVTHQVQGATSEYIPCRAEINHPEVDWERTWRLAVTPGLSSEHLTFLWRMLHNILPCQTRLFRMGMPNISPDICTHCNHNAIGNLNHSLIQCSFNDGAGQYLLSKLSSLASNLQPEDVLLLNIDVADDAKLPSVYLIAAVLSEVWLCRKEKRPCYLLNIRSSLETGINNMRKSRHREAAIKLSSIISIG